MIITSPPKNGQQLNLEPEFGRQMNNIFTLLIDRVCYLSFGLAVPATVQVPLTWLQMMEN